MKITIASDHAGYKLKEELKKYLEELGHEPEDLGTNSEESVDYPDFAKKGAESVAKQENMGILICGSGIGMSMTANKVKGIGQLYAIMNIQQKQQENIMMQTSYALEQEIQMQKQQRN